MMLVMTYIDRSKINGFGIFAKENIPANTVMWEFTPNFDLNLNIELFKSPAKECIKHYGNKGASGAYLLCGDDARFMNHSENPNMSAADERNYAVRDILAGEEITCDYREFDIDFKGF